MTSIVRKSLIAIAAIATLGSAALVSSDDALARGGRGGGGHGGGHYGRHYGSHYGYRHNGYRYYGRYYRFARYGYYGDCYWVWKPWGYVKICPSYD
jgi:hypothetical protein